MSYTRETPQPTHGNIIAKGLSIRVTIKEKKTIRGKAYWLVTPESGSGEIWTDKVNEIR